MKIFHVFKMLIDHSIAAIPVLNNSGLFYGFVDMRDIVVYVSNLYADFQSFSYTDLERLFRLESRFNNAIVGDLMCYPIRKYTPFHPVRAGSSLFTVWEILSREGLHRIPIIKGDGEVIDLITQSMLIDFLWQNIDTISTKAQMTVMELDKSSVPMLTVRTDSKAIVAFRKMSEEDVTGLAVVNDQGQLIDNISLRDLKGFGWNAGSFWRLWSSVGEYKEKIMREFHSHFIPLNPVCVVPTDTLYSVIEKMALQHVHRVFVVDSLETMIPLRIVSQTDVLKQLIKLEPIYPKSVVSD